MIPVWIWGALGLGVAYGLSRTTSKPAPRKEDEGGGGVPLPPAVLSCDGYFAALPSPLNEQVKKAIASPTATKKQLEDLAVALDALGPSAKEAAACVRSAKLGKPDGAGPEPATATCDDAYAALPPPLNDTVKKAVSSGTKEQLAALADSIEKLPNAVAPPAVTKAAAMCLRKAAMGKMSVADTPCEAALNKVPDEPVPAVLGGTMFGGLGLRTAAKVALATETDPKKLDTLGSMLDSIGQVEAGKCLHDRAKELGGGGTPLMFPMDTGPSF